jgi:hypothetical protein
MQERLQRIAETLESQFTIAENRPELLGAASLSRFSEQLYQPIRLNHLLPCLGIVAPPAWT